MSAEVLAQLNPAREGKLRDKEYVAMKTENIGVAQKLIVGSHYIDRMKEEVNQVVSMMISFAKQKHDVTPQEVSLKIESPNCVWGVEGKINQMNRQQNHLRVTCVVKIVLRDGSRCNSGSTGFHSDGHVPFNSHTAQDVWGSLDFLIDGMVEAMPHIKENWEFVLKASEVSLRY